MQTFGLIDIWQFRVRIPEPLFPYRGKESIAAATLEELPNGPVGWYGIDELADLFPANFSNRNPLNIPGPIYGAETDTCLTGPLEAPANVLVDKRGQEFVFRQASNASELRDLVSAAICECFQGYGADGNGHWRLSSIREWWRGRQELVDQLDEEWCDATSIAKWRTALQGGAEGYLRHYAYFVENGRIPISGDRLPEIN